MGGIRMTGIGVDCDRCGKPGVAVTDPKQGEFYTQFSKREDKDERMFVALAKTAVGEQVTIDFEYVCPKCADAIIGYLKKIEMKKEEKPQKKDNGEKKPKEEKKAAPPKEEKKAEPPPEPEPPEPPADEVPDFSDDALFD